MRTTSSWQELGVLVLPNAQETDSFERRADTTAQVWHVNQQRSGLAQELQLDLARMQREGLAGTRAFTTLDNLYRDFLELEDHHI
jgi:hypothetical protein